ncbi:MAG TPA: hypothetical protein VGA99_15730 [bacterium]
MKALSPLALSIFLLTSILYAQETQTRERLQTLVAAKGPDGAAHELENALKDNPKDQAALLMLHLLLATPNDLKRNEAMRLREVIKQLSSKSSAILIPADEPGDRLILSGKVSNAEGLPVSGARVFVFQTDASGCYSPADAKTGRMDEPNSRLFGLMVTGTDGRYEFRTVRPGGYPFPRRDVPESSPLRFIPAHIHFEVTAPGLSSRRFQLVFDDDPRMNPEWQRWAKEQDNPVVKVTRDAEGMQHGVCDIVVQRN